METDQSEKGSDKEEDTDVKDNSDSDDDERGGGLLIPLYEVIKGLLPRLVKPSN